MNVRGRRCALVVAALCLVVACSGNQNPSNPGPLSAALRGIVHLIPTGPPIAGVSVTVQNKTAVTLADGSFSFSGLTVGETAVRLVKDGYVPGDLKLTLVAGDNFFSLGMAPQ